MLVLTRKLNEEIVIDPGPNEIVIKVIRIHGGRDGSRIRLGIQAPDFMVILRRELMTSEGAIVNNNG